MKKITLIFALFFTFCIGFAQTGTLTVGTNDGANTTSSNPAPLQDYYKNSRTQYLYTAAELSAAGFVAGNITAIGWNATSIGTSGLEEGYTISMKSTTTAALTTTFETGTSVVYGPTDFTPSATGAVMFTLTTPFAWDGTSNIIIEICEGATTGAYTTNVVTTFTNTSYASSNSYISDGTAACPTTSGTLLNKKPQLIAIGNIATCFAPTVVVFSNISNTTATIAWTAPATAPASGYEYYYNTTGTAPTDATVATGTATTATSNLTALAPDTIYTIWVRSVCSTSSKSPWSVSQSFRTKCNPITTLPWTENFDSLTTLGSTNFPTCWVKQNGDWATSNETIYNTPNSGANYLRDAYSATNEYIWTPGFDLVAGTSYDFSTFVQGDGYSGWNVDMFYNTQIDATSATQLGATYSPAGGSSASIQPYVKMKRTFVPTTSGTYYFAIRVNQSSLAPWYVAFDDFKLDTTPACTEPTAIMVSNITTTGATISWTAPANAPANGYTYYLSTSSTAPTDTTTPTGTVAAGTTTVNLTGLTAATNYYIWVNSLCATATMSSWSQTTLFAAACSTYDAPYTMNFEGTTGTTAPICTTTQNAGTGNNWTIVNNPGNGFTNRTLQYAYNSANAANAWFFTAGINLTGGTAYDISYKYGNNSTTYTEKLKIAYGTTASATGMTTVLADHPTINTSAATTNTVTFTPPTTGVYYFGFNAYSAADQFNLYVDDIAISANLANETFEDQKYVVYPNPIKDVLNISYFKNIDRIAIYNLLGQEVLTKNTNTTQSQVDMSHLSAGSYILKVTSDNQTKTIKVLKQ
ncbi:hypothetical protein B0A58_15635 [Flavobacterium branchiophilum NBRC 15030 = ATCC 35035]|uniref:Putative secreted protein (Por secretion system target) n=1 Tax=Flavobacterium branchiophilum TaxID=55197 RepID=A0A543G8H3_9FLAO|nr:fibronectin type III domain-containing protein [Flavobacterium branchiophilum]OXA68179.1 hypothetical protein B0A58_15635 [Flavobacterium branchiophilum NBRC 15030 = ATCC 35035]TQM42380.1 putative secreted protein (Por secretion system target) [Flavobacterium branchiophilum]GEM56633.1 T9SS C-terminal target domain-containing protein [Flavobacterium branchiophilum NBRC 15030 = ATCC 35035]